MTSRKVQLPTSVPLTVSEEKKQKTKNKVRTDGKGRKVLLGPKEWAFVQEFVLNEGRMTRTEAAVRAGYSPGISSSVAKRLLDPVQSPHVVDAINELRAEISEKYSTNLEKHLRDLQIIRDKALEKGAYSAAVQAEYRRGQAISLYVDRKEIRVGTIESMSKEEVLKKLEELRKVTTLPEPKAIIDVEVKQLEDNRAPVFVAEGILDELEAPPLAEEIDDGPKRGKLNKTIVGEVDAGEDNED